MMDSVEIQGGKRKVDLSAVRVLAGGVLVHLSLGTLYLFGNISVYIASYVHLKNSAVGAKEVFIVYAAAMLGQSLVCPVAGSVQQALGLRRATLFGGYLMAAGTLLSSSFTTVWALAISYGLVFGLGIGIAYTAPLAIGYAYLPNHQGLVSGLIVAGFGGGASLFNILATAYVNPENKSPVLNAEGDLYFDSSVASRVPGMFVLLGCCHFILVGAGTALLRSPPIPAKKLQSHNSEYSDGEVLPSTPLARGLKDRSHPYQAVSVEPFELEVQQGEQPVESTGGSETLKAPLCGAGSPPQFCTSELPYLPDFWLISLAFICSGMGGVFVAGSYKHIAQAAFSNDAFLTRVGSLASVCNAFGRVFWGVVSDHLGPAPCIMITSALSAMLLSTYSVQALESEVRFTVWTCLIFFAYGSNFALYPCLTARLFGTTHAGGNYGAVLTSFCFASFFGVAFAPPSLDGVLEWCAVGCLAACIMAGVMNIRLSRRLITYQAV